VLIVTDDLLFGSRLQAELAAAGHQPRLAPRPDHEADALLVDLTADAAARVAAVAALVAPRPPALAFYSHVERDVRELAQAAGFELVVPRSRMAREGAALLTGLAGGGTPPPPTGAAPRSA
jgi:hypothetical protein